MGSRRGVLLGLVLVCACDGGGDSAAGGPSAAEQAKEPAQKQAGAAEVDGPRGGAEVEVIHADDQSDAGDVQAADLAFAEPGKAYGQVMIKTYSKDEHIAEFTIVRDDGVRARPGTVHYTAEPRVVVAEAKTVLDEANLLGTGLSADIDGDGATTSKIESECDSGVAVLSTEPAIRFEAVTAFTEAVARFDYGADRQRILANEGAGAILYAPCDSGKIVLGLDTRAPLKMHEVQSPAAFAVYRAPVESVDAEDPFSLKEINAGETPIEHAVYPFREFNVEGDDVKIYAAHLVVFALDPLEPLQHVSVKIAGTKPEFVTMSINEVDAEGKRIRYADGFKAF